MTTNCPDTEAICSLLLEHPRSELKWIGLEVERLIVNSKDKVLHYKDSMKPLLETVVSQLAWQVDYKVGDYLLGLKRGLSAISLEPGAQFEVSGAPQKTIQEVKRLHDEIDTQIFSLPLTKGWRFVEVGMNPWEEASSIEILPSPRYQLMDSYFQTSGTRGRDMMRLSTGLQINLDFNSAEQGIELLRAAYWITPILSTIFANSPYSQGRATKVLSDRHLVWKNTDPRRSGFLPSVFDEGFELKHYAKLVADIPLMYAYDESGNVFDPQGKNFTQLPAELKKANALAAMRQLFSEVRLKPCCIELRCFDQLPDAERYSAVALTVGLLYDESNLKRLAEIFRSVHINTLEKWMDQGAERGLKVEEIYKLGLELLKMAEGGLVRRGFGEETFLESAESILKTTQTPAERLLKQWGSSLVS